MCFLQEHLKKNKKQNRQKKPKKNGKLGFLFFGNGLEVCPLRHSQQCPCRLFLSLHERKDFSRADKDLDKVVYSFQIVKSDEEAYDWHWQEKEALNVPDLTVMSYNCKPRSDVILLHLFGHLPSSGKRCRAEYGDNYCFHPIPSFLTVSVNICLDGLSFPHFTFRWWCSFMKKCIMHNRLSDYYIVALAICETSSPAAVWKSSLQTGMICTAATNPHQRAQWLNEMLDPEQVCSGAASLLEESEVRSEALHREHYTCWESPGCGRINDFCM